ncbi:uncharacterized protein [Palaemon carinicauda]|uniref:uncharacterized protein n=1 Tax=Palaemon carinicauda TaxID=392227 RepID=UPI0035B68608
MAVVPTRGSHHEDHPATRGPSRHKRTIHATRGPPRQEDYPYKRTSPPEDFATRGLRNQRTSPPEDFATRRHHHKRIKTRKPCITGSLQAIWSLVVINDPNSPNVLHSILKLRDLCITMESFLERMIHYYKRTLEKLDNPYHV